MIVASMLYNFLLSCLMLNCSPGTFPDAFFAGPTVVSAERYTFFPSSGWQAITSVEAVWFWVVVDRIQTDQPRHLQALWHYAPSCTVTDDQGTGLTTDPEKETFALCLSEKCHGNFNL
jgi:hypothetical protein